MCALHISFSLRINMQISTTTWLRTNVTNILSLQVPYCILGSRYKDIYTDKSNELFGTNELINSQCFICQ